jgi:serine O-acetyltransferase
MEYQAIRTSSGRVWSTLGAPDLARYVQRQMNALFPDGEEPALDVLEGAAVGALAVMARGWKYIALPGYTKDGEAALSHLHSDRYAAFVALLARELSKAKHTSVATKAYLLNKALHGFDMYHEVELPEVFVFVHPVGTVIGRAQLGNFLCIYQNCSIGGNPRDGHLDYPVLGEGVLMYAKSSIIGASKIGSRVVLGAGSSVINGNVPDGALVAGTSIKPDSANVPVFLARIFHGLTK